MAEEMDIKKEVSPAAVVPPVPPAPGPRVEPKPRPRPDPIARPVISGEQFGKIVARIWASSSLPVEAKREIIDMVGALYGFKVDWGHGTAVKVG